MVGGLTPIARREDTSHHKNEDEFDQLWLDVKSAARHPAPGTPFDQLSAASVPIALDEGVRTGRCGPGDTILLVAFGGGLTWSGTLITL